MVCYSDVLCYRSYGVNEWCVTVDMLCYRSYGVSERCVTVDVLCYRSHGVMWACASPASAGTLRITGATRSTTCTGRWQHLSVSCDTWGDNLE